MALDWFTSPGVEKSKFHSVKQDRKGKRVHFYTEKLLVGVSGVPCSLFSGQRYSLIIEEHPATFLGDHDPGSMWPPLISGEEPPWWYQVSGLKGWA